MNTTIAHDLQAVSGQFHIPGHFLDAAPYGTGHINDTYVVRSRIDAHSVRRTIIQRVNHNIFKDVPRLMQNIQRVTDHIRGKLPSLPGEDPERGTLTVIPTLDAQSYHRDADGNYWRAYVFIERARTYDEVENTAQVREASKAFGTFQKLLLDLPAPRLHETIPDFHHTPRRFARLEAALAADAHNRASTAAAEIRFALDRRDMTGVLLAEHAAGRIPERVTHNDTKINNVMLDDATGRGVAVIDLDTVMPGLVLYDFGDQVRTATCLGAEDERDISRVSFEPELFAAVVGGYLESAREFLTPAEIDALAFSGRLITFEIGIRFLTDHLEGDVYFKTHRPGHNLDRARVQFERVRQMEARAAEMDRLVAQHR